jgi:hypothetical protein
LSAAAARHLHDIGVEQLEQQRQLFGELQQQHEHQHEQQLQLQLLERLQLELVLFGALKAEVACGLSPPGRSGWRIRGPA